MRNTLLAGAARGLAAELAPRRLLPALAAALAVGPIVVIVAISFAALVFSGRLAPYTGVGVGLSLGGAAVIAVVVALASSFRGMVATPQDSTAAVVALIAASVAAAAAPDGGTAPGELPGSALPGSPDTALLTVVAAVGLTTALAGLAFFLLGRFHLGGLVRYLPYPVVGGFLAGTGWLLVRGALGVMADRPVGLRTLGALSEPAVALRWLPGALFALALLLVLRRVKHYLALPAMVLGSIALFYLALAATGTSLARARQLGLLLGPFPDQVLWRPLVFEALGQADWGVVAGQLASVGPVVVIGVVALLLNATGLEIALQRDVDLDRELSTAGVANALAGALGGLPGFQTLSLSSLGHRMAPDSRLVGLACGGLCLATLFAGGSLLALVPKAVVGGLLLCCEAAPGTVLMRRGDPPDDGVFVVESGQVSAQLEIEGEQALRLRTMGPGSVLGEIELYLETPRAASVVAETPCVIWRISAAALLHLKEADPTIAARFHFYMCRILAGRLAKNNELLRTLLK